MNDESEDQDENDEQEDDIELALIFTSEGQVILEEEGELVWASDDDDDFTETFGQEFLDADSDATDVLNYLEDQGLILEDEKGEVQIEQEMNGDGEENEEDEVT